MFKRLYNIDVEENYGKIIVSLLIAIVVFKILLMGLFSSDYQNMMFIPFITSFLEGNGNPYEYYYVNNMLPSFPYPPLMLLIESIGGGIVSILNINSIFVKNVIFKLPLLICDLISVKYLMKLCEKKRKYIIVLYFFSPIILYSIFMHGQLDIIPTTFLVVSVYYLVKGKRKDLIIFVAALSAAVTCKFHIIAVIPLLFWYLLKKRGFKTTLYCTLGTLFLCVIIILPFWSNGFINYVIFNKEQAQITNVYLNYGTVLLYIPVLVIAVLYLRVLQLNNINKELLFCLIGIIFAVFLICVPPMPAWFTWIVPFILIYFIEVDINRYKIMAMYLIFCVFYSIYFVFLHHTEFIDLYFLDYNLANIKVYNDVFKNAAYTLLSAALLVIIFSMYRFGILSNSLYKRSGLPFTLGIAGDSGTGKSELLNNIEKLLTPKKILYIEGDGDHRWERGDKNWEQFTHLDPKANHLYRQAKDLEILRVGAVVRRVEYDHDTGKFTKKHRITPKPYIIMCGLHSLYLPQMRKALDLKIYLDTDETLRRYWKIQRDIGKRGYSKAEIVAQIDKRIPDAERYVYPQKDFADIVITYFDADLKDCFTEEHEVILSLAIRINISIDIEDVLEGLRIFGLRSDHKYEENLRYQTVKFDGNSIISAKIPYESVAWQYISQFEELFAHDILWNTGIDGLVQLFIALAISEKMRGD